MVLWAVMLQFTIRRVSYHMSNLVDVIPIPSQWKRSYSFLVHIMPNVCRLHFFLFHLTPLDPAWELGDSLVEVRYLEKFTLSGHGAIMFQTEGFKSWILNAEVFGTFIGVLAESSLKVINVHKFNLEYDSLHFQLKELGTVFNKWVNEPTCTRSRYCKMMGDQS
jgi:hypothetical protein